MTDSSPHIEKGATPFEMELLLAGRRDAVTPHAEQRILMGLGISAGLFAAGSGASQVEAISGVKATLAKGFFATLGVGAAVSAVAALVVWAGAAAQAPQVTEPQRPTRAAEPRVAQRAAQSAPSPPVVIERRPVATAEPVTPPKPSTRPASTPDSLPAELAALDRARRALGRGDSALALSLLDDYTRRFSKQRLGSEARVLRMEALSKQGDRQAAARLAKKFLAAHPSSPYARRVRTLLREAEQPAQTRP